MRFHLVTIFPDLCAPYLAGSILGRAIERKIISVFYYNPRDYISDKKERLDDRPYGGGPGMVLRPEPFVRAISAAEKVVKRKGGRAKIFFLTPRGKLLKQNDLPKLSQKYTDLILISGRYEGIDARVRKIFKAQELAVGEITLSGGELPVLTLIEALSRILPKVMGDEKSDEGKRVAGRDVYTRPAKFNFRKKNYLVPKILLSGHQQKIDIFRAGARPISKNK